jgi:hypothetical protein
MIVICGDSWACGEWTVRTNGLVKNPHRGLAQYLHEDGHEVVNVGFAGASNLESLIALRSALEILTKSSKFDNESITVIIFQTEWWRDIWCVQHPVGLPNLIEAISEDLINKTISFWQYKLVTVAKDYNVKIHLVGGASDTMWLSNFEQEYPGLFVLCQSLTNLCINNTSRIDDPVFGIRPPDELTTVAKSLCYTAKDLEYLVDQINQSTMRFNVFDAHPEYFWPDGLHANRRGHYKLYELVKEKLL